MVFLLFHMIICSFILNGIWQVWYILFVTAAFTGCVIIFHRVRYKIIVFVLPFEENYITKLPVLKITVIHRNFFDMLQLLELGMSMIIQVLR